MHTTAIKKTPVFLSFIVMGFVDFVGVTVGYARPELGLSDFHAQFIPFFTFIWFAFLAIPAGHWQSVYSKKNVLIAGVVLTGLGCMLNLSVYSLLFLVLGFTLIGMGNTLIQVSTGPLLQDLTTPEKVTGDISFGQFFKSLTAMLGPLLALAMIRITGNWQSSFLVYALFAVGVAIWLALEKIPEKKISEAKTPRPQDYLALFNTRYLVMMFLGIVALVGIDVGMITAISGYFEKTFAITTEKSTLAISVYFMSMMIGRFLGGVILGRVNAHKALLLTTLTSLLVFVLFMFIKQVNTAFLVIGLFGLCSANFFPLIYSISINHDLSKSNQISGFLIMGISGAAIAPLLMGKLNELYGLTISFMVVIALLTYLFGLSLYNHAKKKPY